MQSYDFIIIGSGVAGLTFALKAAAHGHAWDRRHHRLHPVEDATSPGS